MNTALKSDEISCALVGSARYADRRPVQGRNPFANTSHLSFKLLHRCTRRWSSQRDDPTDGDLHKS